MAIVDGTRAVEKAQQLAKRYTEKALKSLSKLPDGEYKEILYEVTTNLLNRNV